MTIDSVDLGVPQLRVVETIGRGGFSVVYKAVDTRLNRPVAVKVLTTITSKTDLERFDLECQIHGPLSTHPNIVTIHDAGYTPTGSPYLVMEFLDQGSLADHLDRHGPMPWEQVVEWMIRVCEAVEAAHAAGVLHRDIKPANILLSADGPKLADFGIACGSDATSPQFAVSWLHAPPEAEMNRRDERSDVYSLASTAFQLITGTAPFWRAGDDPLPALLRRITEEPAPRMAPTLAPSWLDELLAAGLAKDPAHRPQSAAAFAQALRDGERAPAIAPAVAFAASPTTVLPSTRTIVTPAPVGTGPLAGNAISGPGVHHLSISGPGGHPYAPSGPGTHPYSVSGPGTHPYSVSGLGTHPYAVSQQGGVNGFAPAATPKHTSRTKAPAAAAALIALAIVGLLVSPARALLTGNENPAAATGGDETTGDSTGSTVTTVGADESATTTEAGVTTTTGADETTSTTEATMTTGDETPSSVTTPTSSPSSTDPTTPTTGDSTPPPDTDITIPDLRHLTVAEATAELEDRGFSGSIAESFQPSNSVAEGLVIGSDPGNGSTVSADSTITLRVSTGPAPVTVPTVVGLTQAEAVAVLDEAGLTASVVTVDVAADSGNDGLVVASDPGAGSEVPAGSTVTLSVGQAPEGPGPTIVTIPPVIAPVEATPITIGELAP